MREVAERHPKSFRVLLTGGDTVGNLLREISTGVIHFFLTKPWAEQELRQMLELAAITQALRSDQGREREGA